jgi:predicted MFS family arabinose efflux permease
VTTANLRHGGLLIAGVMLSMSLGAMPFFLVGAFAPDIQESLGLSEVMFGAIVSGHFLVAVLFSFPAGHIGEARGPSWTISVAAVGVAVSLLLVALAPNGIALAAAILIGGTANTLTQPGGNKALAKALPPERLGMALALKQSAIPVAAMLGGLAVASLGVAVGWRWTIALVSLLGLVVLASARMMPGRETGVSPTSQRRPRGSLRRLAPLAAAGICASAATTGMVAFFVDAAIRGGVSKGAAGIWWALGGVAGVAGRLVAGWVTDRWADRIDLGRMLAGFWLIGAVGFVLLAAAGSWPMRVAATVPTFVFGWGWNGMFHHATVQWSGGTPSWATGITQTGLSIGGSFGPTLFGAILGATSFRVSWMATAGLLVAAAALVSLSHRSAIPNPAAR